MPLCSENHCLQTLEKALCGSWELSNRGATGSTNTNSALEVGNGKIVCIFLCDDWPNDCVRPVALSVVS